MHIIRPGRLRAVAALSIAALSIGALAVACTPAPGGGTTTTTTTIATPTAPTITEFTVKGSVGPAPSVVALSWTVSDPNGDQLTCRIDADGDDVDDLVIPNCAGTHRRNVTFDDAGSYTARLSVSDSTFAPVSTQRLIDVAAGPAETFDLVLRGTEALTPVQADAFLLAEARWESLIVRGIADFPTVPRPPCLPATSPDLPPVIDDLVIDVAVSPIDGVGNILGQAGPTCFDTSTDLPLHGIMQFDSADVADLLADGSFDEVILHEMGHVLGIGTMWDTTIFGGSRKVITGAGGSNPVFTGPRGVAEFDLLGRAGNVPVENSGSAGTRDAHWRESTFANELMTGYLNPSVNPLSRLTIASLADLGYQVDLSAADAYALPGGAGALRAPSGAVSGTILRPTPAPA